MSPVDRTAAPPKRTRPAPVTPRSTHVAIFGLVHPSLALGRLCRYMSRVHRSVVRETLRPRDLSLRDKSAGRLRRSSAAARSLGTAGRYVSTF